MVQELRASAQSMLDGMHVNNDKLARRCLAICDLTERLQTALSLERARTAELTRELAAVKGSARPLPSRDELPSEFGDIFGDIFKSADARR